MTKTILFDLGNTLYKNEEFDKQYKRQLIRLLARDRGVGIEEAEKILNETADRLEDSGRKHVTKVATMEALGYTRNQVHEAFCRNKPKEFLREDKELAEMLSRLGKKYTLGIVSNFRSSHTREILEALGVNPRVFKVIIGEDNVAEIKPNPEGFLKAMEDAKSRPEDTIYVADSITKDLIPAKSVGIATVHVGGESKEDESVDAYIGSIYGLPDVLEGVIRWKRY